MDTAAAHLDFAGKGLGISLPGTHILRVVRRDEFDNWLAKKAGDRGIEIMEGITVKEVQPREDRVVVDTDMGTFTAGVVVGADGSNGVTRRCILPHDPVHTARVLEVLTPSYPISNFSGPGRESVAYFDFFCVPSGIAGYTWDFPTQLKGQPMRCWGVYDTNILAGLQRPALKKPLLEEMMRHGFDLNDVELKGHPIRWFSPQNRLSMPRVLLVGDAAGADPMFGEGISIALGYGALAAGEIGESIARDDFSFARYKSRVLRSPLGQTLLARWAISQVLYRLRWPWIQRFLWRSMGWFIRLASWVLVLNWGKRMPALDPDRWGYS